MPARWLNKRSFQLIPDGLKPAIAACIVIVQPEPYRTHVAPSFDIQTMSSLANCRPGPWNKAEEQIIEEDWCGPALEQGGEPPNEAVVERVLDNPTDSLVSRCSILVVQEYMANREALFNETGPQFSQKGRLSPAVVPHYRPS
jgi:hypothetical protein